MTTHRKTQIARRRLLGGAVLAPFLAPSLGCGFLLYPERKGRTSGRIDVGVLIVDLVWLLPGIVPGVVCLAVDYSTGCIYASGGSRAEKRPEDEDPRPLHAVVELDGRVVAHAAAEARPVAEGPGAGRLLELMWKEEVDVEHLRERGVVKVGRPAGAVAEAAFRELI